MFCSRCGAHNEEGTRFCQSCGAPLNEGQAGGQGGYTRTHTVPNQGYAAASKAYQQPASNTVVIREITQDQLPAKFRPLGAWAYFGYTLLFSIPLVGFILLIVFSFSDTNINRRNYARSFFCLLILAAVIALIVALAGGIGALAFRRYY